MNTTVTLTDLGDVLSPADVQRVLGIGRNATYELLASGKLPSIRVTQRRIIVTKQALEMFLGLATNTPRRSDATLSRTAGHRPSVSGDVEAAFEKLPP